MTIAEQIARAKTDYDNVYTAGYEKGKAEGGGGGEDLFQYATSGNGLFANATFPDNYELTINMPNVIESMERVVRYAKGLRKVTLKGNTANKAISFQYAFQGDTKSLLEIVDATEWGDGGLKPSYANNMFSNPTLHTVLGEIDFSECVNVNSTFSSASTLINIRFKAGTLSRSIDTLSGCRVLSKESLTSIVRGLSDTASGQTLTVSRTAVNKAFETSEGANDGSESTEWTALVGEKSNWTISLV